MKGVIYSYADPNGKMIKNKQGNTVPSGKEEYERTLFYLKV